MVYPNLVMMTSVYVLGIDKIMAVHVHDFMQGSMFTLLSTGSFVACLCCGHWLISLYIHTLDSLILNRNIEPHFNLRQCVEKMHGNHLKRFPNLYWTIMHLL